jgi:hypothetical protein
MAELNAAKKPAYLEQRKQSLQKKTDQTLIGEMQERLKELE